MGGPRSVSELMLPLGKFPYTLDQVAALLGVDFDRITRYVRFMEVDLAQKPPSASTDRLESADLRMMAFRVRRHPLDQELEWRVPFREFVRYCNDKGVGVHTTSYDNDEGFVDGEPADA